MINIKFDDKIIKRKFDLIAKRIKVESPIFTGEISWRLARNIKNAINLGKRYTGEYHHNTGIGLSKAIQSVKTSKNTFLVRVNPIYSSLQVPRKNGKMRWVKSPKLYAGYVEHGTNHSQPQNYFHKGYSRTVANLDEDITKFKRKIIR